MILIAPAPGVVLNVTTMAVVPEVFTEVPPLICAVQTVVFPEVILVVPAAQYRASDPDTPTSKLAAVVIVVVVRITTASMTALAGTQLTPVVVAALPAF